MIERLLPGSSEPAISCTSTGGVGVTPAFCIIRSASAALGIASGEPLYVARSRPAGAGHRGPRQALDTRGKAARLQLDRAGGSAICGGGCRRRARALDPPAAPARLYAEPMSRSRAGIRRLAGQACVITTRPTLTRACSAAASSSAGGGLKTNVGFSSRPRRFILASTRRAESRSWRVRRRDFVRQTRPSLSPWIATLDALSVGACRAGRT